MAVVDNCDNLEEHVEALRDEIQTGVLTSLYRLQEHHLEMMSLSLEVYQACNSTIFYSQTLYSFTKIMGNWYHVMLCNKKLQLVFTANIEIVSDFPLIYYT